MPAGGSLGRGGTARGDRPCFLHSTVGPGRERGRRPALDRLLRGRRGPPSTGVNGQSVRGSWPFDFAQDRLPRAPLLETANAPPAAGRQRGPGCPLRLCASPAVRAIGFLWKFLPDRAKPPFKRPGDPPTLPQSAAGRSGNDGTDVGTKRTDWLAPAGRGEVPRQRPGVRRAGRRTAHATSAAAPPSRSSGAGRAARRCS